MPEITKEMEEAYLRGKGSKCPHCGDKVQAGTPELGDDDVCVPVECQNCNETWTEYYKLAGILEALDPDGGANIDEFEENHEHGPDAEEAEIFPISFEVETCGLISSGQIIGRHSVRNVKEEKSVMSTLEKLYGKKNIKQINRIDLGSA